LADLCRHITLLPGDVVLTGAPADFGVSRSETSSSADHGHRTADPAVVEAPGPAYDGGHQATDATAVRAVAWSASDVRGRQRPSGLRDHRDASGGVALASGGATASAARSGELLCRGS